jgi:hypothetical protein
MMRRESGYYPPGAEFDPNAPWNQPDPVECCEECCRPNRAEDDEHCDLCEPEYEKDGATVSPTIECVDCACHTEIKDECRDEECSGCHAKEDDYDGPDRKDED